MGKSSKAKKKLKNTDWEEFVASGVTSKVDDDAGGWHTGTASMVLDEDMEEQQAPGEAAPEAAMEAGDALAAAGGEKKRKWALGDSFVDLLARGGTWDI